MFITHNLSNRHKMLEILGKFHLQGYHPDEFHEKHVVLDKDGKFHVVGFHRTTDCPCGLSGWYFRNVCPREDEFGCDM
jgi:hypothetical protein